MLVACAPRMLDEVSAWAVFVFRAVAMQGFCRQHKHSGAWTLEHCQDLSHFSLANPAFRGAALSGSYFCPCSPQSVLPKHLPPAGAGAHLRPSCHWALFKLKIHTPTLFHCCESSLASRALCTTSEKVHSPSWSLSCTAASPIAAVTALPSCFSSPSFADTPHTHTAVVGAAHSSDTCHLL